jgi:hypothetical protein
VRADSVFLSTTTKSADTALALTSVRSFEYADGTETGNGALGLLVGAAVGGTLGLLGGRESGNDGCHTCGTFVTALTALGAIIGFAAGSSTSEPVWVLPTRSQTSRAMVIAGSPVLQWRIRF